MAEQDKAAYDELVSLLSQRQQDKARTLGEITETDNLPPIPVSPYALDPPIYGGPPELAKLAHQLMMRAPNLRKFVSSIQYGPTEDTIGEFLLNQKQGGEYFPPSKFGDTNLLGLYGIDTKRISLNPRLHHSPDQMKGTLVHELAHAGSKMGTRGEDESKKAAGLYYKSQGIENPAVKAKSAIDELMKQFESLKTQFPGLQIKIEK